MLRPRSIVVAALVGAASITLGGGATADAATKLTAKLSGQAEVPKASDGTGTASVTLRGQKRQICFNITLRNVGDVQMGHIHKGGNGVAGPIVVPLFDRNTSHPTGCASASRKRIRAIRRHPQRFYVNVHNAEFPAGAARGQLHRR
jgi:CHRD domain